MPRPVKGQRKSYTVAHKIAVVDWHREHGSNETKTSKQFQIHRKMVHNWDLGYANLIAHDNSRDRKRRKLTEGSAPLSLELDDELFYYLMDERIAGRAVTNSMLQVKAVQIAEEKKIVNFKASPGYIQRFKRRYEISIRSGTNEAQKNPEQLLEVLATWRESVTMLRRQFNYTPYEIANMDQTQCRFDMPRHRTNELKGKKSVRIKSTGHQKAGFTVALCAHANGTKKTALVIFKEPQGVLGPIVRRNLILPHNVLVTASLNGWMTQKKFSFWLKYIWEHYEDTERPRLLVLDRYAPHFSAPSVRAMQRRNTRHTLIPAGCTSLLQPADVSWNRPFKAKMYELWSAWMQAENTRELTVQGNMRMASRQQVLDWVSIAWDAVSEETIIKSFLVTGISNALDGSQDHLIHDQLERQLPSFQEFIDEHFQSDDDDVDGFAGFPDEDL